jgi:hypothetical protein
MTTGRQRGAKPVTARDWLFGSRPRRLVLRFVMKGRPSRSGWTQTEIAHACGLSRHGGATAHIQGLVALGLLEECDGRYHRPKRQTALFRRVANLIDELDEVPEVRIDDLPA